MDNGTATHPPCPMCDPSILPEDYEPIANDAVMVRPDGTTMLLRGAVKAYLNGIDVTNQAKEADPEHGIVVAYHRAMLPTKDGREMVRHLCNRTGAGPYVLYESGYEWGAKREEQHACQMVLTGEVVIIDAVTGEAPVLAEVA